MALRLNDEQRQIFDRVMAAAQDENVADRFIFVQGAAGTGKTFLYNAIIHNLMARNVSVMPLAWTGLAASLLKNGRTVHSAFKLPLLLDASSTSSVTYQSELGEEIRNTKVIIWDEISMTNKDAFHVVERALKDLSNRNAPFANKVVVVGGDFKQCLPIVFQSDRTSVAAACVKTSALWQRFRETRLTINMRVDPDEQLFAAWLDRLGKGQLDAADDNEHVRRMVGERRTNDDWKIVQVPRQCVVNDLDTLMDRVFGDMTLGQVANKAILSPLNDNCNAINDLMVQRIAPDQVEFVSLSADSVDTEEELQRETFTVEFLNSLNPSGFPPHRLILKEGIMVMLLKNLDVRDGLCNGSRLLIRRLSENYVEAEKINLDGRLTGSTVFIPRVDFTSDSSRTLPFVMTRRQFPLKPAYAMTINKAQGQTFDTVGIYLPIPVFQHGQLYVAFSRAKRMNKVFVCALEKSRQGKLVRGSEDTYTINIVYRDVLQ